MKDIREAISEGVRHWQTMAVYVGLPRLLADVGGSDAVALDYNLSENRRLIGIIMAHNLTYTKYGDYYIMKIAIRC